MPAQSPFVTTRDGTLGYQVMGPLCIIVMAAREYEDVVWREYLDMMASVTPSAQSAAELSFVYAPRVSISAGQRRMASDFAAQYRPARRVALISESAAVRVALHALHAVRIMRPHLAFKLSDTRKAFGWLRECEPFDIDAAHDAFVELASRCSISIPR